MTHCHIKFHMPASATQRSVSNRKQHVDFARQSCCIHCTKKLSIIAQNSRIPLLRIVAVAPSSHVRETATDGKKLKSAKVWWALVALRS
jgi:hypothetical protein